MNRARRWGATALALCAAVGAVPRPGFAGAEGSDCCIPHDTPGCDDADCSELVCEMDKACCIVPWDEACAQLAQQHCVACGVLSNCCMIRPEPGCDVASCEKLVCAQLPQCCTVGWGQDPFVISPACVDLATELCGDLCHYLADGCGNPNTETCCEGHDTPYCNDEECCRRICLGDPDDPLVEADTWCCTVEWDGLCAQRATNNPHCDCFGQPGDCCEANFAFAGCLNAECEACVCRAMPECCMFSWSPFCVDVAEFTCVQECGCEVKIPPCPEDTENDCCYAGYDEGGCRDEVCCNAVCAVNPGCCGDAWGFDCAEDAIALCEGCGGCSSPLVSADPPDGTVDARRPIPPEGGPAAGIGSVDQPINVYVEQAQADAGCFTLCESATFGLDPNSVTFVQDHISGRYEIFLARPITPGAVTTLYYGDRVAARYYYHPGNVNGDDVTNPLDLLAIVDILNGVTEAPWGVYSDDIDRSGQLSPQDILALIDLLNGAGQLDPWNGTPRPDPGRCP
jgi:hypothetical protein